MEIDAILNHGRDVIPNVNFKKREKLTLVAVDVDADDDETDVATLVAKGLQPRRQSGGGVFEEARRRPGHRTDGDTSLRIGSLHSSLSFNKESLFYDQLAGLFGPLARLLW